MHAQATRDPDAAAEERLVAALRARGQRVTSQRLVIGRLLRELDRHVTAEEVLRRAGERLPGMSLPTVYATLDLLADLGLARRVSVGGPVLYDPRTEDHVHLRCRSCGSCIGLSPPTRRPSKRWPASWRQRLAPQHGRASCGGTRRPIVASPP